MMPGRTQGPFWLLLGAAEEGTTEAFRSTIQSEDDRSVRGAFALARLNGMYYPLARRWSAARGGVPSHQGDAWRAQLGALERYKRTIELLNETAEDAGVDFAVIKNVQSVEHVPRDVDVFVPAEDCERWIQALYSHGAELTSFNDAEISLRASGCLEIDVYTRIHYFGRDFLDEDGLAHAQRRITSHGLSYPSLTPETSFLLNTAHALFGHGAITLLDFLEMRRLTTGGANLDVCRAAADRLGWGRVLDLWTDRLDDIGRRIYVEKAPPSFPLRLGRAFILRAVSALDGPPLAPHERTILNLSLLWDDLVFVMEDSGIDRVVRRSGAARGLVNSAGHRLRILRGDRKGPAAGPEESS